MSVQATIFGIIATRDKYESDAAWMESLRGTAKALFDEKEQWRIRYERLRGAVNGTVAADLEYTESIAKENNQLRAELAALSRELEAAKGREAVLARTCASMRSSYDQTTDRLDETTRELERVRAELEEAKAEVRIQKEAYETAAADRKFTAELSEQQAEQINGLQQQLTALRAAPRSEGAVVQSEVPSDFANKMLNALDDALNAARKLQDACPQLSRVEIGNIDEVISHIETAVDRGEHAKGNIQ